MRECVSVFCVFADRMNKMCLMVIFKGVFHSKSQPLKLEGPSAVTIDPDIAFSHPGILDTWIKPSGQILDLKHDLKPHSMSVFL